MILRHRSGQLLLIVCLCIAALAPASAASSAYRTGFTRWRAATNQFSSWQLNGVSRASDGTLQLNPATASAGVDPYAPGAYNGHNFYNGGSFIVGEAISPAVTTSFGFFEAIPSWNATTPAGTWIETQVRAQSAGRWTKWYNLGVWASDTATVERHSVNGQSDADGYAATDTLVLSAKKGAATAFQVKLRLFRASGTAVPSIQNASVAYSTRASKPGVLTAGNPANWNRRLAVPECSQMVYPDGGEVWCSPTSTSMVLGYWSNDTGPCEPRVRAAVAGVYDWLYDGHGNWTFNTAYAATQGHEGYVVRFSSMRQIESWVAAGVPVVVSYAWKNNLTGAPFGSSNGHLAVIVGFDAAGNPIVNDPASASNPEVQHIYQRAEFESLWLEHSGGTAYLIYPAGHPVPNL